MQSVIKPISIFVAPAIQLLNRARGLPVNTAP